MFKVLINSPRKPWSQSCRRKGRLQCKGFAEKEGFKPGMRVRGRWSTNNNKYFADVTILGLNDKFSKMQLLA